MDWWARQDKEVMMEALGDENRTSVAEVLRALNRWCVGADTMVWTVFDIAILENMYRQYDMHVPHSFGKLKIAEHYLVYYQRS